MAPPKRLALALVLRLASALLFAPEDRSVYLYDCWLFRRPGAGLTTLHYLYHDGENYKGVAQAASADGAHFADEGGVVRVDGDAVWLGSGSVWPELGADGAEEGNGTEYIMNYSQDYGAQAGTQRIFFARTRDWRAWTPVTDGDGRFERARARARARALSPGGADRSSRESPRSPRTF